MKQRSRKAMKPYIVKISVLSFKRSCLPESIKKDLRCSVWDFSKGQPYEEKRTVNSDRWIKISDNLWIRNLKKFAKELAQQGVQIVSGLARGVDGTVHREIIDKKGQAVGVLGCGIDLIYPKENFQLFYDMYANQTVISEYPPGSEPLKWHFPERNRIISGLSDGILVTEARARSGSLITADCGLDQNKEVFAVPGMITDKHCQGCHGLIKQGAKLVENVDDILTEFSEFTGFSRKFPKHSAKSLAKAEKGCMIC